MREILFRGKTESGEFAVGYYLETLRYNNLHWIWNGKEYVKVDPATVGQFTGLTDKNGKKIFEGDIVEAVLTDGTHYGFSWGRQVVVFDRGAFCLKDRRNETTPMCNYAANVAFEVIGNIHDNLELLEVDNEFT